MQDFRKLDVWRRSHALVLQIYTISRQFPMEERFGMCSQIRRAASSIPANIAEGCGRKGKAELRQFLYTSMGSASEVEYFLLLAHNLKMIDQTQHLRVETELLQIKRMLAALLQRLDS